MNLVRGRSLYSVTSATALAVSIRRLGLLVGRSQWMRQVLAKIEVKSMGRIRDAFARVKAGQNEDAVSLPDAARKKGHVSRPESQSAASFNFMDYSLGLTGAHERDGLMPLSVAASLEPAALVREVALDSQRLDPHLVTLSDYDPGAAEQYHRLAGTLITAANERPLKRLLLTSALRGEGRTCVLLNLAAALAQAHRRVLVLDTDLKRPSIARLLGLEAEVGLPELLAEGGDGVDPRCRVQPGGFDVLPTCGQPENSTQLLVSVEFEQLLDRFDRQYDFILFDSAPLLEVGDAQLLLRLVDSALIVVAPNRCTGAQASRVTAQIAREDIFGVIFNRSAQ